MILRMPSYCDRFECIADKCNDNCCIGWEIDIDDDTAKYYADVKCELSEKFEKCISDGETRNFILGSDERCPFLDAKNLCEIYAVLGKDKLCKICTEHPRYYEWFDGVKEGGIGLCCEEAARIILSCRDDFSYTETETEYEECDEYDGLLYDFLFEAREKIISYMQKRDIPLRCRINDVLSYASMLQNNADNGNFDDVDISHADKMHDFDMKVVLEFFCTLEPLDKGRIPYLEKIMQMTGAVSEKKAVFEKEYPDVCRYLENIAVYFIWRHFMKGVFSGEFFSAVFFAAISVAVIEYCMICHFVENGSLSFDDCVRIAKEHSKEIEYSDDNLEAVMEMAYDVFY